MAHEKIVNMIQFNSSVKTKLACKIMCHVFAKFHIVLFALQIVKEIFRKSPPEALCVGYDVSGVVKSVGSRVTSVKGGDEVVGKCFIIFNIEATKVKALKRERERERKKER